MRFLIATCVAVVTVPVLAACSTLNDELMEELTIRGFTDVTQQELIDTMTSNDSATYFANAGTCRVVLQYTQDTAYVGDEWMLVERSSQGSEYDIVLPNPTVNKLALIDYFSGCFTDGDQPTE